VAENTKPDSGGAAYIAKRYVESLRETLDEHREEITQLRNVDLPKLREDLTNTRLALANLTGRLAVIAGLVSIVVSAAVAVVVKLLTK
jgi:hypothetical protein